VEENMSLDKAIKSKKEKRKPYRKSKAFDRTCRNHGSCNWCRDNRMIKYKRQELLEDDDGEDNNDL
jgi:hypothetical protein